MDPIVDALAISAQAEGNVKSSPPHFHKLPYQFPKSPIRCWQKKTSCHFHFLISECVDQIFNARLRGPFLPGPSNRRPCSRWQSMALNELRDFNSFFPGAPILGAKDKGITRAAALGMILKKDFSILFLLGAFSDNIFIQLYYNFYFAFSSNVLGGLLAFNGLLMVFSLPFFH